jgi:hypothetical protein
MKFACRGKKIFYKRRGYRCIALVKAKAEDIRDKKLRKGLRFLSIYTIHLRLEA